MIHRPHFGLQRHTSIAAVQYQPLMSVLLVLVRDGFQQLQLHFQDILARCQASAVSYSEYVGIHSDGGLAERSIQDDICRFPADARQFSPMLPGYQEPCQRGCRPEYGRS